VANLAESDLDHSGKGSRRRDHPKGALCVVPQCRRERTPGQVAERGAEPVQAQDRGKRVIDAWRQGAHGDLDEFEHQKLDILSGRALLSQAKGGPHALNRILVERSWRGDRGSNMSDDAAAHNELSGRVSKRKAQVFLLGKGKKIIPFHRLHIAARMGAHRTSLSSCRSGGRAEETGGDGSLPIRSGKSRSIASSNSLATFAMIRLAWMDTDT
jgi:hypothetical protein